MSIISHWADDFGESDWVGPSLLLHIMFHFPSQNSQIEQFLGLLKA